MRLPENPDARQRDAAIKIRSGTDAMIWLGGFLDIVCCPCICVLAFAVMAGMASAQAGQMAEQRPAMRHIERIPQVKRIVNFRKKPFNPDDPKMKEGCIICMGDFAEGDGKAIAELNCGHIFHEDCLKDWTAKNQFSCPMCRAPI